MSSRDGDHTLPERPTVCNSARAAFGTPVPGQLDAEHVRSACTAPNTKKSYRNYIKGVSAWIRQPREPPDIFFDKDGSINLSAFTPAHFEDCTR
jgi:hypothetical protein